MLLFPPFRGIRVFSCERFALVFQLKVNQPTLYQPHPYRSTTSDPSLSFGSTSLQTHLPTNTYIQIMDIDSWIDSVASCSPKTTDAESPRTPPAAYSPNWTTQAMPALNTGVFDPRYEVTPFKSLARPLPVVALEQLLTKLGGIQQNCVEDANGVFPFMRENDEKKMVNALLLLLASCSARSLR